jgi:ubiquinone biosynthesis protein
MQGIDSIAVIGRTYRHLTRYQQIIRVLFRYGFGDLVDSLHVRRYLDAVLAMLSRHEREERVEGLTRAQRVRKVLEELGPTFVKLGQLLSTRPDLIPIEYINELSKLQDHVPPFPGDAAREIVEKEIGQPTDCLFASFGEEAVAAASIAQGHRAVLHDGTVVFVKVQRPGIRRTIEVDLEIMMHLASLLENHSEDISVLHPTQIVDEFSRTLNRELDFGIEAGNIERFADHFRHEEGLLVPTVIRSHSGSRVLTMTYVDGIKAADLDELRKAGFDFSDLASRGADLMMQQIFNHGFFHADPHPGNLYVMRDGRLCYVDFGMMGRVSRDEREHLAGLLSQAVARNERKAVQDLLALVRCDGEPDRTDLERDVGDFVDRHMYRSLQNLDVGRVLQDLYRICRRHELVLRPHIYLMLKALATMEELGRRLDPDFRIAEHIKPFITRLRRRRLSPIRIARDLGDGGMEFVHLLQDFPDQVRSIIKQIREGRIKVEFEHRGLDDMLQTHERISNRISSAIVLASMIVGSSLMTLSDIPPKWNGMPILGIGGFVVAGVLGMWLLWSIMRSGHT